MFTDNNLEQIRDIFKKDYKEDFTIEMTKMSYFMYKIIINEYKFYAFNLESNITFNHQRIPKRLHIEANKQYIETYKILKLNKIIKEVLNG